MNLKSRVGEALRFITFAFYPMTTIFGCVIATLLLDFVLGAVLIQHPNASTLHEILLALITGATASFFVAIVVELTGNYRRNRLAWHELDDYYRTISDVELHKQVLMKKTPGQRTTELGPEDLDKEACAEEDEPLDPVQAVWRQIPRLIPTVKTILAEDKAFLTEREILALETISFQYSIIRSIVNVKLQYPFLHNMMNHPDENCLKQAYPQNIFDEMPSWIRKHLATKESEASLARLTDEIMGNEFLLKEYMKEYSISQASLDQKNAIETNDATLEEEKQFAIETEASDEEEFRLRNEEVYARLHEDSASEDSVIISKCCLNIAGAIEQLEKEIKRKPYVGSMLRWTRANCK